MSFCLLRQYSKVSVVSQTNLFMAPVTMSDATDVLAVQPQCL